MDEINSMTYRILKSLERQWPVETKRPHAVSIGMDGILFVRKGLITRVIWSNVASTITIIFSKANWQKAGISDGPSPISELNVNWFNIHLMKAIKEKSVNTEYDF